MSKSSDENSPDGSHSVSVFIQRLKKDDSAAADQIWQRFFDRLLPLARAKLRTVSDRALDEEDLLVSVFDRFFRAARENRFAKLHDRDDLWQILLMLTDRKVIEYFRKTGAQKRGSGQLRSLADLGNSEGPWQEVVDEQLGPEYIAAFNDELSHVFAQLNDPLLRELAVLKLEGYENREIAQRLKIGLSSVERKLRIIRGLWEKQPPLPSE